MRPTTASPGAGEDEAALARAFGRRERWAFDDAYRRYGSLLYSTALNVLHDGQEAEDCVHDVLVRLWRRPESYAAERGSLRSFLTVCTRNDALSRRRAALRRARLADRAAAEAPVADEFAVDDFVENRRIRDALDALPPEQREALSLAFFAGKTHVEVAAELNQPLGTVKSRISLGLRKLAAALGGAR